MCIRDRFNTLTGLYQPDSGEIRFQERSLVGMKPDRITSAGISRTFQNIRLFSHMTVLDNVLVGMHSRLHSGLSDILLSSKGFHSSEKDARRKAMALIELTGLAGREHERSAVVDGALQGTDRYLRQSDSLDRA